VLHEATTTAPETIISSLYVALTAAHDVAYTFYACYNVKSEIMMQVTEHDWYEQMHKNHSSK